MVKFESGTFHCKVKLLTNRGITDHLKFLLVSSGGVVGGALQLLNGESNMVATFLAKFELLCLLVNLSFRLVVISPTHKEFSKRQEPS